MTTETVISLLIQAVSAAAAVGGLVFAGIQLKSLAESTQSSADSSRMANLMAVLQLESSIAAARSRWVEVVERVNDLAHPSGGQPVDQKALAFAQTLLGEAVEQYLNTMDRLCSCIVRNLVNEDVYRRDYRKWVDETVRRFPEFFQAGTRHPHILSCQRAWSDDKSAKDPSVAALLSSGKL